MNKYYYNLQCRTPAALEKRPVRPRRRRRSRGCGGYSFARPHGNRYELPQSGRVVPVATRISKYFPGCYAGTTRYSTGIKQWYIQAWLLPRSIWCTFRCVYKVKVFQNLFSDRIQQPQPSLELFGSAFASSKSCTISSSCADTAAYSAVVHLLYIA